MKKQYLFASSANSSNSIRTPIHVVVAKPTRVCNANCSYCSSPPLEEVGYDFEPEWNIELFKNYFDKIYPFMAEGSYWIWHGGEPMLMGADFYQQSFDYANTLMKKTGKKIRFSMQTNLLGYNEKWKAVFENVFEGSISSSYDPDETNRTIKGSWENYSRIFKRSLSKCVEDGFYPMVIGVYSENNAHKMLDVYEWSKSLKEKSFPIRFNYCVPTGRSVNKEEIISPDTYADYLIKIYDKWITDVPDFTVTPLDQMFKKTIGADGLGHCPWTKSCGGKFLALEPNGDVYNCTDFADLGEEFKFGNILVDNVPNLLNSKPALQIKKRSFNLPESCIKCEHFIECEGGCARDSYLFNNDLYGKFYYCKSWKRVFTRIKESIILGQADAIIAKYGFDPEVVKVYVKASIQNHFGYDISFDGFKGVVNNYTFAENFNKSFDMPTFVVRNQKKIIPIIAV